MLKFKNNASTTLSGSINDTQTSISVTNSSGFPILSGADVFYATLYEESGDVEINIEIVKVTGTTGSVWTIERGQDGTTARARAGITPCYIELRATAATMGEMLQSGNNLSDLGSAATARTNLGLAGMATQDPAAVAITGGTITGVSIESLDSQTTLKDNADATKQARFELAGITTGTTRTLTVPNASGTLALTSDLSSGYQPLDSDLTALAGVSANGLLARTGSGTATVRAITQPAAGITVTNGDGVSGNPTLALANDLAAVEGLSTTGFVRRTGSETWSASAIVDGDLPAALTGKTYNGLTPTANATGFSLAGGTTSKTLTVNKSITLDGVDGTTVTLPATSGTVALNNQTTYVGTTAIAINRASASQALTGITSIDGNAATATTATKATNLAGGNGTTLLGAVGYQSGTDTTTLLSPNVTATKKFLSQTGTGTNGAAPAWDAPTKSDVGLSNVANVDTTNAANISSGTLPAARMPAITGDVTTAAGAVASTIANNVVSNAKLATVATSTIKGRVTAATGNVEDLTPAQVRTMLNVADGATANTGTVTSVALSLPSIMTVSGSPVTSAGTLTATLASQTANRFLASPDGSAGAPAFRAIVATDVPTLNQSTTGTASNVTGVVALGNGGTGGTTAATARSNLGAAESLLQGGSAFDFNSYRPATPGLLRVAWNAGDTSMVNAPNGNNTGFLLASQGSHDLWNAQMFFEQGATGSMWTRGSTDGGGTRTWGSWNKVWSSGNDGASSGLDADLLDGKHASEFFGHVTTHTTSAPDSAPSGVSSGDTTIDGSLRGWQWITSLSPRGSGYGVQLALSDTTNGYAMLRSKVSGAWGAWHRVYTQGYMGAGSGLDADLLDGVHKDTLEASLRANAAITGGGTVSVSAEAEVKWTSRYIVISNGSGAHFSTNGYFDIDMPGAGAVITGVGGAPSATVTSGGIPLIGYQALYYILPISGANVSANANFRIASYTAALTVPHNWVLLCASNGDMGVWFFPNGVKLKLNESLSLSAHDARNADLLDGQHGSFYRDAGNLNAGVVPDAQLPARLRYDSQLVTDWNNAKGNGYYMAIGGVNAPTASIWYLGQVVNHNADWVTQTVWGFSTNSEVTDSQTYYRECNGGEWTAWQRVWSKEGELDARYGLKHNPTFTGTVTTPNLAFNTAGGRITGDLSNATLANRLSFQTSTTNGTTAVQAIANGTGTASYYVAFAGSDPANAAYGWLSATTGGIDIYSDKTGTGTVQPVRVLTGGTVRTTVGALGGFDLATGMREARVAMGANDIDLRAANYFTKTVSGATTFTVSNVPAAGTVASFILELTNGGSATVTWWSGVKWAGGTAPTLTSAGVDILGFYTHDGGTTWRGMVLAKDSK